MGNSIQHMKNPSTKGRGRLHLGFFDTEEEADTLLFSLMIQSCLCQALQLSNWILLYIFTKAMGFAGIDACEA